MSDLKHPNCPFCGNTFYAIGGNDSQLIHCPKCQIIITETVNENRPIEDGLRSELDAAYRRIAELEKLIPGPFQLVITIPENGCIDCPIDAVGCPWSENRWDVYYPSDKGCPRCPKEIKS